MTANFPLPKIQTTVILSSTVGCVTAQAARQQINHIIGGILVADRIKEIRTSLGITQEEMAHKVGVTVSTMNRWEKGKSKPHKVLLQVIEKMYSDSKEN